MKSRITVLLSSLLVAGSLHAQGVAIDVLEATPSQYAPELSFVAMLEAEEHAKLTPRVSGFLVSQNFSDGAMVNQGDVIFEIDPAPYQQALAIAKANHQKAKASLERVTIIHQRVAALQNTGGAAQANLDDANTELLVAQATLAQSQATLEQAQDNLAFTKVRAPYSGQLGKASFSKGDMVSPASGPLIDLVMVHPINAIFSVDQKTFAAERAKHDFDSQFAIQGTDKQGTLSFVDNKINPASGTIQLAASFDNSDNTLLPNQVVRVELVDNTPVDGFWVPQAAVQQDLHQQFVFVVNDSKAERRGVTVLERQGKNVFVTTGIMPGEQVIVSGLTRVRDGVAVVVSEL